MKDINLRKIFNKISVEELNKFINSYKLNLPKSYQNFILKNNGGYPEVGSFYVEKIDIEFGINSFYSINLNYKDLDILDRLENIGSSNEMMDNYQVNTKELPSFLYPFGNNQGGATFCISMRESDFDAIYLHYWDGSDLQYITDSFEEFIDGLE